MLLISLFACQDPDDRGGASPADPQADPTTDLPSDTLAGTPVDLPAGTSERASWTVAIYMDGDNNLESLVTHDLNELERGGSDDAVQVVVQADRIDGHSAKDGDWTDTRRYHIVEDDTTDVVSPVVEEPGELDMGDADVLADFLTWTDANYPADHYLVVMWDHGDGWAFAPQAQGAVSSDDTSGSELSIADGDLRRGLEPLVDSHGPIDVIAFDACNMASWEVAYSLKDQARFMTASEATVGASGLQYDLAIQALRADPQTTPRHLAHLMAHDMVEVGGERTGSALDLSKMDGVAEAMDALAGVVMTQPDGIARITASRDAAHAASKAWRDWYIDAGDLSDVAAASDDAAFAEAAGGVRTAIDAAVIGRWGGHTALWNSGLTTFLSPRSAYWLDLYADGEGAVWARDTRWDDMLRTMHDAP